MSSYNELEILPKESRVSKFSGWKTENHITVVIDKNLFLQYGRYYDFQNKNSKEIFRVGTCETHNRETIDDRVLFNDFLPASYHSS